MTPGDDVLSEPAVRRVQRRGLRLPRQRADRIKLLYSDWTGVVLMAKTLEQGVFRWPKMQNGARRLSATQLSALLDRLDWARVYSPRRM